MAECRRILKPKGSAVFIFQPNYDKIGKMRLWLWEFLLWAAKEWNLVQDVYWWAIDAMPLAGTNRKYGLLRQSVKMCIWLGSPDCYRNQDAVLWTPSQATSARHRADIALRTGPSGRTYRNSTIAKSADERGGTTPFNLLPILNRRPTGRCGTSSRCHALRCGCLVVPLHSASRWRAARSVLWKRDDASGRTGSRCQQSDRHREGEEISGDCEATNCEGVNLDQRKLVVGAASIVRLV